MAASSTFIDPSIFQQLQSKIDEDIQLREQLRAILNDLEKQGRIAQSVIARAHSTPSARCGELAAECEVSIQQQVQIISSLAAIASQHPYYKYNGIWTKDLQNTVFYILMSAWLGGPSSQGQPGRLLTIDEVGTILRVPVNLKDRDAFHLTIEDYLHALISVIDELARLAVNSVTLGDYRRPIQISQFIKDVHAGFQILNLKNDALRRRSDSIKYSVKKVEDVVYDLSLRNLIPKDT